MNRAAGRLRARFDELVTPLGIRAKHYGVLALLRDEPLTQIEMARILWIDRTTMVALVDELEQLQFVGRARHPADRRAYAVTLTEQGREVLCAATQAADTAEEEYFAHLSVAEREQLRTLLIKVLQNVGEESVK